MSEFTSVDERQWIHEDVVGHAIDRCTLWRDDTISFSFVKLPPNYDLGLHKHESWVAVYLVEGTMKWESDGEERKVGAGDFYFVPDGEEHVETSIDECLVMIIKAEPNVQYRIDPAGNRI
ncbi:cupin domain-containing protein [Pseudonocardia sp. CA-142604]|uniref:cupin domain-containing protein n=1 Tax=Pseudonocardia sp. CA-142604 TaxID=3240024 RepID=UPI003D9506DC